MGRVGRGLLGLSFLSRLCLPVVLVLFLCVDLRLAIRCFPLIRGDLAGAWLGAGRCPHPLVVCGLGIKVAVIAPRTYQSVLSIGVVVALTGVIGTPGKLAY